jgi:hypothetical protein
MEKLSNSQILCFIADYTSATLNEVKDALLGNLVLEEIKMQIDYNRENKKES